MSLLLIMQYKQIFKNTQSYMGAKGKVLNEIKVFVKYYILPFDYQVH